MAVDQQPNNHLRVDSAFFGVADLAEVVFLVCLEVERGDVVEHQRHIAACQGVVEASGRDLVAVGTRAAAPQGPFAGRQLTDTRPISARTRSMSSRLVGSTIRAITRSRNTSSATMSKPRLAYTPARASYNSPQEVLSTRERGTTCRDAGPLAALANSPAADGGTITAFKRAGAIPRSSIP